MMIFRLSHVVYTVSETIAGLFTALYCGWGLGEVLC